jgi:hypothetical protein
MDVTFTSIGNRIELVHTGIEVFEQCFAEYANAAPA